MDSPWEKVFSNTHKKDYYFNKVTKETTWELPATKRAKLSEKEENDEQKGRDKETGKTTGSNSEIHGQPIVIKPENIPSSRDIWTEPSLQVNDYMKGIYQSGKMTDLNGKETGKT